MRLQFTVDRVTNWGKKPEPKPCDSAFKEGDNWTVNIPSIESLMKFIEKNGDIIIKKDHITIYDDYVE